MDTDFKKIQRNNCTLYINQRLNNDSLEDALLADEETLQKRYKPTDVFSSDNSRVCKFTAKFDGSDKVVYLKKYLYRSTWDFIKHLVYPSRAKRAFKATLMLQKDGFDAPVVVAMGERNSSFLNRSNFLATLEPKNAQQLYRYIPKSENNLTTEQLREKRRLIKEFGRTIGKLHNSGISHGDLKVVNVLARQEENGWRFFFIDNERTKKFCKLPPWLRLKNLVQLNMFRDSIGRTDRMRFFKSYIHEKNSIAGKQKILIQKIIAKTNWRIEKMQK